MARSNGRPALGAAYSINEIEFLLSIDHDLAVSLDADARSSWPDLLSSPNAVTVNGTDDRELLTVLRWTDVEKARQRVQGRLDQRVTLLQRLGLDQEQIARVLASSQTAVSRRHRASVASIWAELSPFDL